MIPESEVERISQARYDALAQQMPEMYLKAALEVGLIKIIEENP